MVGVCEHIGIDADGIAETKANHFGNCPVCGAYLDMRDLTQMLAHVHDAEIDFRNGDRFSASVRTRRHTPGQPSVFDIDNLNLTLTGKSTPTTASCTVTARQAPALTFQATLVPRAD
jgi:hypothetical protein